MIFNVLTLNMVFISRVRLDFLYFINCKAGVKILKLLSHEWNKFRLQRQKHSFYLNFLYFNIFFGFWTCFFQILDTASRTWSDVTIAFHFHCENNSQWKYNFYSMDKTRYFTAENIINEGGCNYIWKKILCILS